MSESKRLTVEELREGALSAASSVDTFAAKGHSRGQIKRLRDLIGALADRLEEAERERDEARTPVKATEQLEQATAMIEFLEQDRNTYRAIYQSAEASATRNGQERDRLQAENDDLRERIKELTSD